VGANCREAGSYSEPEATRARVATGREGVSKFRPEVGTCQVQLTIQRLGTEYKQMFRQRLYEATAWCLGRPRNGAATTFRTSVLMPDLISRADDKQFSWNYDIDDHSGDVENVCLSLRRAGGFVLTGIPEKWCCALGLFSTCREEHQREKATFGNFPRRLVAKRLLSLRRDPVGPFARFALRRLDLHLHLLGDLRAEEATDAVVLPVGRFRQLRNGP